MITEQTSRVMLRGRWRTVDYRTGEDVIIGVFIVDWRSGWGGSSDVATVIPEVSISHHAGVVTPAGALIQIEARSHYDGETYLTVDVPEQGR